jgi:membrane protease YdiL (CAAX protease family)
MATLTRVTPAPARSRLAQLVVRRPLVSYFALAYAISWGLVLPMTLSRNIGIGLLPYDLPDALSLALFILASVIGPNVAALIVTGLTDGRVGVRALLRRIVQWRVAPQWYLVALFANMAIWTLTYSVALGPEVLTAAATRWPLLATAFLPSVAFGMLIPSIGEEPGWRGFALPRLQERYGPVGASLILGLLHGLWHLPALGTMMLGPVSLAEIPPFVLTAAAATFIYTWIFNHTAGSVLLAMLTHAAGNAASQWLGLILKQSGLDAPQPGLTGWLLDSGWLNALAYGLVTVALVAATRGRLGRRVSEAMIAEPAMGDA